MFYMKYHIVNAKLNLLELCTPVKPCVWIGIDLLILTTFFFCRKWLFLHITSQMRSYELTSLMGWGVVTFLAAKFQWYCNAQKQHLQFAKDFPHRNNWTLGVKQTRMEYILQNSAKAVTQGS